MSDGSAGIAELGPNAGLIEEMYRLYQDNPQAVAPGWREFFEDYVPRGQVAPPTARLRRQLPPLPTASAPAPAPAPVPGRAAPRRPARG